MNKIKKEDTYIKGIPPNHLIYKICSFNLNIYDTINRNEMISKIIDYLFTDIHNIPLDIVCLSGIKELKVMNELVEQLNIKNNNDLMPYQIYPIIKQNLQSSNSFVYTWGSSSNLLSSSNRLNKLNSDSLILSRYPIITSFITGINQDKKETSSVPILLGAKEPSILSNKILVANINMRGYLVSVYNITLTEDYIGLNNNDIRKNECNEILRIIKENNTKMKEQNNIYKLIINDINILCGNINVNEYIQNNINYEFTDLIKLLNAIDFSRVLYEHKILNTNVFNERLNYILVILLDIDNIEYNELIKKTYDLIKTTAIMSYVVEDVKSNDNYPIEMLFILNQHDKF